MRTNVRSHHCITTVRQKNHSSTASASKQHAEGGDCSDTCLDAKVSYARRVGEEEAAMRQSRMDLNMRLDVSVLSGLGGRRQEVMIRRAI
jgi:hypothetical protein